MSRATDIATKIKNDMTMELPALVHRDRALLAEVCKELGLVPDAVHLAQVATLMKARKLFTHEEFPKWVYPDGLDQPGVLVQDATAEREAMAPSLKVVK